MLVSLRVEEICDVCLIESGEISLIHKAGSRRKLCSVGEERGTSDDWLPYTLDLLQQRLQWLQFSSRYVWSHLHEGRKRAVGRGSRDLS